MVKVMLADDWINKYSPEMEHGHLKTYETFGEEKKFIQSIEPRKIWTLIAEENEVFIESGYRWVNRLAYIVTEIPWEENYCGDNAIIIKWGYFTDDEEGE